MIGWEATGAGMVPAMDEDSGADGAALSEGAVELSEPWVGMVPGSEEDAAASLCSPRLSPNRDSSMLAQPDSAAAAAIAQRTAHRRAAIRDVICRLCAPAVLPGVA